MLDDGALLRRATNRSGDSPLTWAAGPLLAADRVLDVCCGAGALAGELPAGRWLGIDVNAGPPHAARLRAAPTSLPVRTSAVDGLALLLALPRLPDLDGLFAELRRVLRPGGTLVLLVPSAVRRSVLELRLSAVLTDVHRSWANRSALDRAGWLLAAADFAVLGDDRVAFSLPLPDAQAAGRVGRRVAARRVLARTAAGRGASPGAGHADRVGRTGPGAAPSASSSGRPPLKRIPRSAGRGADHDRPLLHGCRARRPGRRPHR